MAEKSQKTGMVGIGLTFIAGALTVLVVVRATERWQGEKGEPLIPAEKRAAGTLEMPLLSPSTPSANEWKLADHPGKIVVANYFATWCGPCMAELLDLKQLADEYRPKGVEFVAVSLDQGSDDKNGPSRENVLKKFAAERSFDWPILLPPAASWVWKVDFPIPQTFLYDRQGRLARKILGGIKGQGVRASLDELLDEKNAPASRASEGT